MSEPEPPPIRPDLTPEVFKAQHVQAIATAKANGFEALKQKFMDIWAQAQIALGKIKDKITRKKTGQDPEALNKTLEGRLDDANSEKQTVSLTKIHVTEALKAYKQDPALIPVAESQTGGLILRKLASTIENPDSLPDSMTPYIYKLMHEAIDKPTANPLTLLTEEEAKQLKEINTETSGQILGIIASTAQKKGIPETEIVEWLGRVVEAPPPPPQQEKTQQEQLQDRDLSVRAVRKGDVDPRMGDLDPITESGLTHEWRYIWTRFPEKKDTELLMGLSTPEKLDRYLGIMLEDELKGMNLRSEDYDRLPEPMKDQLGAHISEQFSERVKILMGKLFRKVDESSPDEFWEEASRQGSIWENTDILSQAILTQIENLRHIKYSANSNMNKLRFFIPAPLEEDVLLPAKTKWEGKDVKTSVGDEKLVRRFRTPFYNDVRAENFSKFFYSIYNSSKDEIGVRKFLHNATALFYQPEPEKGGYYRQLETYARHFMPGSSVDLIAQLPDADVVYSASQLEDKLLEADFAKFNWVFQPTLSTLDPELKMTERNQATLDYLRKIYPDLDPESDWRHRRALIMGVGDSHSVGLKTIEHGARADAVAMSEFGHGRDVASYDKSDHKPYMALNPFNHYGIRYSTDRSTFGNLLFLPVKGKLLDQKFGIWDHNKAMDLMKKNMNAYIVGRDKSLEDSMSLMDYTNLGKTGSIYTRGGWRKYHAYEAYMDGKGDSHIIVNSCNNIENIGIEVLRDFFDRIGMYNSKFYTDEGQPQRRQLVEHIFGRYFKDSKHSVDEVFNELEQGDDLTHSYNEFYYKTMARAMKQRIPTKFIRYERNRDVKDRSRGYEEIRKKTGLELDPYHQAVRDLVAAEVYERQAATKLIKKELKDKRDQYGHLSLTSARRLHENPVEYELTPEKIQKYLTNMNVGDERIKNALDVYTQIDKWVDSEHLDKWANKFDEESNDAFQFAPAVEELERTLISQAAAGEQAPARAFMDIANIQEKVTDVFADYWEKLNEIAANGKQDFMPLVHDLHVAKSQLEIDIDPHYAEEFVHHMAAVTMSYFKKDTVARSWLTRPFTFNRKNSMAAEFAGTGRGVWEWGVKDCDQFIYSLEALNIIPKDPFEAGVPPKYKMEQIKVPIPLTRKQIPTPFKHKVRQPDREWTGKKLRNEFGASQKHIIVEMLQYYVPIALVYIMWQYSLKAMEDASSDED